MAPAFEPRNAYEFARQNEQSFLAKVQGSAGFQKVLGTFSIASGVSVDRAHLHEFAEDLCRCCLKEADTALDWQGMLAAERSQVEELKQKLVKCNLSAMKQLMVHNSGVHNSGELGDDTICLHEPVHYLDESTKELVMAIVCDKVRQLGQGHAPPSLVDALTRSVSQGQEAGSRSVEELREARVELEKLRTELRGTRVLLEESEEKAARLQRELTLTTHELVTARQELKDAEQKLAELAAREKALQQENDALRDENSNLKKVCEQQKIELQQSKDEIAKLTGELESERRANAELRLELERSQKELRASQEKARALEHELNELTCRFKVLEAEADEMREELSRRNNTRTCGTQTTLTGGKLDDQVAEIKKLKLMLEELQMKLKELVARCKRKFGAEVKEVVDELGLHDVLKEETVFQRLYDDALDRVGRMEKLRAKIRKERTIIGDDPRAVAIDYPSSQESVMSAVEKSSLRGPKKLLPSVRKPQGDVQGEGKLDRSQSLPSLSRERTQQPVSVFMLDMGGRGSRRRTSIC